MLHFADPLINFLHFADPPPQFVAFCWSPSSICCILLIPLVTSQFMRKSIHPHFFALLNALLNLSNFTESCTRFSFFSLAESAPQFFKIQVQCTISIFLFLSFWAIFTFLQNSGNLAISSEDVVSPGICRIPLEKCFRWPAIRTLHRLNSPFRLNTEFGEGGGLPLNFYIDGHWGNYPKNKKSGKT